MRARVFVTLKPSVFDPAGHHRHRGAAYPGLQHRQGRPAGQVLRARHRRTSEDEARRLVAEAADKLLSNPVIETLSDRDMKFAVVVFPGSNCDHDAHYAAKHVLGQQAEFVWHKDTSLGGADVVILPGGFAHGDYLRTGAIARFSPIMHEVKTVCRGRRPGPRHLQRLPGAARSRAAAGCDASQPQRKVPVRARAVRVEQTDTPFTLAAAPGSPPHADRARRGQLLRRARRPRSPGEEPPGRSSATSTTPTARPTTLRACATRRATSSA